MSNYFQDRFEIEKLDNGAMVVVGLVDDGIKKEHRKEIHEAVMERLYQIGLAYKLKFCSLIDIFGDLKLAEPQCKTFILELQFIEKMIDDPLLRKVIPEIISVAEECVKQKGAVKFIISGS